MTSQKDSADTDNSVFLRGRLADVPVIRELPSGDVMATFRLTVSRGPGGRVGRVKVDSIDCASVRARVRRTLARAAPGDQLELQGRLQRRFWRSDAGPTSRYTVDVETIKVTRADRRVVG